MILARHVIPIAHHIVIHVKVHIHIMLKMEHVFHVHNPHVLSVLSTVQTSVSNAKVAIPTIMEHVKVAPYPIA